jgi:hypothetical protein
LATYEEEYKKAVENRKNGIYTGYSPDEIDRKYGKTIAPTYEQKMSSLSDHHQYEKDKIANGWYDNADNRKMATTDELRNYYIYKQSGNTDHVGKYDPKYDDLQAYYGVDAEERNKYTPAQWDEFIAGKTKEDYGNQPKDQTVSYTGGGSNYTPRPRLTYDEAANRVKQQLDPLYDRAVENIRRQRYQNELNASEVASKRGLSHSGLAADQLNKIAIASQSNVSDLDAKRASQIAEQAQRMMEREDDLELRERAQALSEQLGLGQLDLSRDQFNRGIYESDREYGYREKRDQVGDSRYDQELDYRNSRDKRRDAEWESTNKWDRWAWQQQFDRGKYESDREYDYKNKWALADFFQELDGKSSFARQLQEQELALARQASARRTSGGSSGGRSSGGGSSSGSAKRKTKDNTYRDALSYWNSQLDLVKKEGAVRVEQALRSDVNAIQAILDNGYDVDTYIDALYNAASQGKFRSRKDYDSYVKSLNDY